VCSAVEIKTSERAVEDCQVFLISRAFGIHHLRPGSIVVFHSLPCKVAGGSVPATYKIVRFIGGRFLGVLGRMYVGLVKFLAGTIRTLCFTLKLKKMKTLELKATGLFALTAEEERNISGGFWLQVLQGIAIAGGGALIQDWDNFKAGLRGDPERAK
jgi:hypothetical protein